MRSIYLQKNKTVFKVSELPTERFAESLGLPGVPKIKFLNKTAANSKKNASTVPDIRVEDAEITEEVIQDEESNGNTEDEGADVGQSPSEGEPTEPVNVSSKSSKVYQLSILLFKLTY
jgi:ATP-dependent RNA helicase DDX10/DBP4